MIRGKLTVLGVHLLMLILYLLIIFLLSSNQLDRFVIYFVDVLLSICKFFEAIVFFCVLCILQFSVPLSPCVILLCLFHIL